MDAQSWFALGVIVTFCIVIATIAHFEERDNDDE